MGKPTDRLPRFYAVDYPIAGIPFANPEIRFSPANQTSDKPCFAFHSAFTGKVIVTLNRSPSI